ncbi:MAG TPA: hypothetical protein VIP07_10455 [Candidatus Limnocylindria bacterium]
MERVERAPAPDGYGWDASWTGWHLSWGSVFVGALAGLVAAVLFSLIALAIGAHKAVDDRILKWADLGPVTIIFSVLGAFFASLIGAWVAAKMSGARRAEPAILHGVAAWLVSMAIVLLFAALSGANTLGGGYLGGLTPPGAPTPSTTPVDPNTAIAIRNAAVGSILGMLIGLMGAVVGGWFASGEPMNVNHYRTRETGYGRTTVASDRTTRM